MSTAGGAGWGGDRPRWSGSFDGSDTWSKMRRGQGTRTQGARRRHFFVYLSNIRRTSAKTEKAPGGPWTLPQRRPRLLSGGADESSCPKSNEDRSHSLVSESGLNLRVKEPGFRSISKWPDLMYWHLEPRNTFLFIERVCVPEKRYAHQFSNDWLPLLLGIQRAIFKLISVFFKASCAVI